MRFRVLTVGALVLSVALFGCSGGSSGNDDELPPPPDGNPTDPPDGPPDDEEPPEDTPQLSVDDVSVAESGGSVNFIVRADGGNLDNVWVDFATADGTATAGSDYVAASGTVVFSAGQPEQTVTIDIIDDDEPEGDETFSLVLSNPQNAEIAVAEGVATIRDDDGGVECGEPEMDAATEQHAFLWKDCGNGVWRLRVTGGSGGAVYEGTIEAAEAFPAVIPVDLEGDDVLEHAPPERIAFTLNADSGTDGFNFDPPSDAGTCFALSAPADTQVLVGPDRQAVTSPFDLDSLAACGEAGPARAYNVVVVFTDDQRFDTLQYMPNVTDRLMPHGVNFVNAYVPTPLCCPARASAYSGGFFARNTLVLDNNPPNGGMSAYDDTVNAGTLLQGVGYRTSFVGKWMNDYIRFKPYVPPGWDHFAGRASWANMSAWDRFDYILGSSRESSSVGTEENTSGQYHVYYERDRILEFIEETPADQPYFVFWAPTPPHAPMVPDEADEGAFADFTYRDRGYGETDLSDKPEWVRNPTDGMPSGDDEEVRDQLRSLLSVDRSIGAIIDTVAARGELDETVFIVTSDNGYMWGEHGLWAKNKAYEESLRVPMLVVMPGIAPRDDESLVYAVLDLAPTLYDIAGVSGDSDGTSLLPLLEDPSSPWRDQLFFEKITPSRSVNGLWAGVREGDWKYIEYFNGEAELYDLASDPYELENAVGDPAYGEVRDRLKAAMEAQLGLAIKPLYRRRTEGTLDEAYSLQMEPWGGTAPYTWTMEEGSLPPGLSLDESTGEIAGTPTSLGTWDFRLRITGSGIARQAERAETYVSEQITIRIR